MRYCYTKPRRYLEVGERYVCEHPVYSVCTLFKNNDKGLAIIQQRFNPVNKTTYWSELDPWLAYDLYTNPGFQRYFDNHADKCQNGLYPTVTVRQIMWALRMKPLRKERWSTVFDRSNI